MEDCEELRTVFIDIERAGAKVTSPIIEVAAVATRAGSYEELARLEMRVAFDIKKANVRHLGLSKFQPSTWDYAIPEREAAAKLSAFLRQHATCRRTSKDGNEYRLATLAGHHVEHDASSLRHWFRRQGEYFSAARATLCTLQLARWFFDANQGLVPPPDFRLETLAEYFSLPTKPDHTALNDARSSVELARVIAHYSRVGIRTDAA